ncbi:hypothetical protein MKW98_014163 [Papaver atlanticum]|uniref:Uncharacterized protein n=1 Tax=Papaver atlanticum TaxID=357466 RepID=A0AAD4XGY6_9MAGN|nr:hypothetical protein MKW98_014163 [Papaver atlanticum]
MLIESISDEKDVCLIIYFSEFVMCMDLSLARNLREASAREREWPTLVLSTYLFQGCPVNTFEFTRPLLRSLDHDLPKYTLDLSYALLFGRIFWALYRTLLYPWLDHSWLPQPLILPTDAYEKL